MTYNNTADVSESASLQRRVTIAAVEEGAPGDPVKWTYDNRFGWASAPGWGDAFASAVAGSVEDPGADETVITDGMILSQVQSMLAT